MSFKGKKKISNVYDSAEGYNIYANRYDRSKGYLDSFEGTTLLQILGDLWDKDVLDLGAGTGRLVPHLKNLGGTVFATDISEEMLKVLQKSYSDVECEVADAAELPYEDGRFDMVVASFFIVHLKDLQEVFDEVYRVLKDGGEFVLTNINQRKAPKLKTDEGEIVIRSFYHRPENVIKALEESFFHIEKEEFVMDGKVWVNQIIKARK